MFRFLNLSTGLIVVFAAAAIAVPTSAITAEAGSWQNSNKSESVSLAEPTQNSNDLTPGWNQADTCEWSIEDGTLTLRPLGDGTTGKIYQRPSWGTDFVRFVVEGTVTLSGVSDNGDSCHHWDGG